MYNVLVIYGSTASGKSALALSLAQQINGVIINADSAQVYTNAPVLSNSPTIAEKKQVNHYLFNYKCVSNGYSVGNWLLDATNSINNALQQNFTPIVVGGTGMYINSLLYGLSNLPSSLQKKQQSIDTFNQLGYTNFFNMLSQIDPQFTQKFTDKQRLMRAYEVYLITNTPLSQLQQQNPPKPNHNFKCYNVFIQQNKPMLYTNIQSRFTQMLQNGAIEEVKALQNQQYYKKFLGAYEISLYLNNTYNLQQTISQASLKTNQYAKRQLTWFKNKIKHNLIIQNNSASNVSLIKKIFTN